MWMPLDTHHPSKHLLETKYTPSSQQHYPKAMAPPQQDNAPWHTANTAQEQLEEHNKGPEVLATQHTGPRGSTIKRPGARHHRTPSEVFSPRLDRSELFWLHKGNLHNTRQVTLCPVYTLKCTLMGCKNVTDSLKDNTGLLLKKNSKQLFSYSGYILIAVLMKRLPTHIIINAK